MSKNRLLALVLCAVVLTVGPVIWWTVTDNTALIRDLREFLKRTEPATGRTAYRVAEEFLTEAERTEFDNLAALDRWDGMASRIGRQVQAHQDRLGNDSPARLTQVHRWIMRVSQLQEAAHGMLTSARYGRSVREAREQFPGLRDEMDKLLKEQPLP